MAPEEDADRRRRWQPRYSLWHLFDNYSLSPAQLKPNLKNDAEAQTSTAIIGRQAGLTITPICRNMAYLGEIWVPTIY